MSENAKNAKKKYVPPKVRVWGSVSDLTHAVGGDMQGGSTGGGVPG